MLPIFVSLDSTEERYDRLHFSGREVQLSLLKRPRHLNIPPSKNVSNLPVGHSNLVGE